MRAIIMRDLAVALRSGGAVGLGVAFFLIFVLISALGLGRDVAAMRIAAPGVLWVGCLLATLLSLDRMFQADWEEGSLDGLRLAPMPLESVVIAKIVANWIGAGVPLVIIAPVLAVMLNYPIAGLGWLVAGLFVGSLALSALGAIGAALTLGVRRGGLLLTLLVMPLFVPTLVFGVLSAQVSVNGTPPGQPFFLLGGLTLFALVFAPPVAAWALRLAMR